MLYDAVDLVFESVDGEVGSFLHVSSDGGVGCCEGNQDGVDTRVHQMHDLDCGTKIWEV